MVLSAVKKARLKSFERFCSKKARLNYSNIPVTQYKGFHLPDPRTHNQLQLQHVTNYALAFSSRTWIRGNQAETRIF